MSPADVPSELVEKAARVMYQAGAWCGVCEFGGWSTCRGCRETVSGYARHALAAVLPDIQAQALRDAADVLYGDERAEGPLWHSLSVQTWLRDRADRMKPTACPRCCPEPCCDHRNTEYGNCTDCHNTDHNHARCPDHGANRAARLTATAEEPS